MRVDPSRYWYQDKIHFSLWGLLPFTLAFKACTAVRRFCYRQRLITSKRFDVPIIVVGNITVGGTGKTPFVIWLVNFLRQQGYKPGIDSRGVGGKQKKKPRYVYANDDVKEVGDEALLMVKETACPLVIGIDRVKAVEALLKHKDCNIVVSDDGLQHYRLQRDVEIVMVDGTRGFGNQHLLPAGPLRESVSRLNSVDFVVVNGGEQLPIKRLFPLSLSSQRKLGSRERYLDPSFRWDDNGGLNYNRRRDESNDSRWDKMFTMQLYPKNFIALNNTSTQIDINSFHTIIGKKIHAVAGIGNPQKFFQSLRNLQLDVIPHIFSDHYLYQENDLIFHDNLPIVMTAKDAVKCVAFSDDIHNLWYLNVDVQLNPGFQTQILNKINLLL